MLNAITSVQAKMPEQSRVSKPRLRFGRRWNVVRFLSCGGTMLVILGVTGVTGLLGSVSRANLFNPPTWIHWVHLCFGVFVLAVAVTGNKKLLHRAVERNVAREDFQSGLSLQIVDGGMIAPP